MAWWQIIGVAAGVITGFTIIAKFVWKGLEEFVDARRAYPVLMGIAEQFKPDSGSSLYDKITHITEAMDKAEERFDRVETDLQNLTRQLEAYLTVR